MSMMNKSGVQAMVILLLCILTVSCNRGISSSGDATSTAQKQNSISIYAHETNDLYQLVKAGLPISARFDDIALAVDSTLDGGTLLILAKAYPQEKTALPKSFYRRVKEKNLNVFIEYPDRLPSGLTGSIVDTEKERFVVTSDFFGSEMSSMDILDAGLYKYVKVPDRTSHLKGAKVAGFDQAVYGIEGTSSAPILFEEDGVLVSTTKLSNFNQGRYSPLHAWQCAVGAILTHLSIPLEKNALQWTPLVRPTYEAKATLSNQAYFDAVDRGAEWYEKARFLIHPDWKDHWQTIDVQSLPVGPPMDLKLPSGDGSLGVMEGHYSYINPDGSQQYRYWLRADCVAETAMTLATANGIKQNSKYLETAGNLMDFLFRSETFRTTHSQDPNQSSYGLIGWADTNMDKYYGDDNARVILGSVLAAQTMENPKWDKQILELILANFRTSGSKGFRKNSLRGGEINETTWQVLMDGDLENIAPHYESWLWATYLWLYDRTGYKPLLKKAKKAISITMENYPTNWKWTNGLQQERARMILPLAWLVRSEDNSQHRAWLHLLCDDLLAHQVECGALREELGIGGNGKYGAPKSNADYGTNEAPLIHFNGDPVADMLYTTNFAFFALNEAAQATQDPTYLAAVDKLADFLVRIQSTSSGRADLDGCWFRAFDYEHWEYYGSNADHGWGAWGTLTGWTQSFITTTLALKLENTSYWEKTRNSTVANEVEEVWQEMLPGVEHGK